MPAASCWGRKEDEYLENRRLTPPESFWQYDSSLVCRQLVFSMDSVHKLHLPSDSRIASTELFSRGHTSWINYWAEPYLDYSVVCEENVVSVHQDVWFAGPGHGSGCAWNIAMDLSLTELVTDLCLGSTENVDFRGVAVPLLAAV